MQEQVFVINKRFKVNVEKNEVIDIGTGLKTRLEPRLMKLLCILLDSHGKVVKREFIIKEIWDDYPGANESLNQAVSFLRKLLNDERKEIIQTQPKSGYIFQATISQENETSLVSKRKNSLVIVIACAVLLLLFFIVDKYLRDKNIATQQFNEKNGAEMSRYDSIHQARQLKLYAKDTLGKAAKGDSVYHTDTARH